MEHYNLEKDIASDLKEQFELECPNFADGGTQHKTCRTLWTSMDCGTAQQTRGMAPLGTAWSVATSPAMLGALAAFAAIGIPSAKDEHLQLFCCHLLIFIASGHARKELLLPLGRQILADFF